MGRKARIASFLRLGCTRFVSKTTSRLRWGSIHNDVPVKPRWPKDSAEKCVPDEEGSLGVSHPRAQLDPDGRGCLFVNSRTR